MLLLRVLGLRLSPPPGELPGFSILLDDVRVSTLGSRESERERFLILVGEIVLKYPPKQTAAGDLVVPDRERRSAQTALETVANVVAVVTGAGRSLSSPNPYVALKAESDEDIELLGSAGEIHGMRGRARGSVAIDLALEDNLLADLTDRFDGVALLAEARSVEHSTGRFHELVRLFERAFARPAPLLPPLLDEFLNPTFGYTVGELTRWLETLRHPATHADVRSDFVLEGDVRPVIARMEQAAHDVLLNKAEWRSPSTDRRSVWEPTGGTRNANGDVYMIQHSKGTLVGELSDQWGDYPLDLETSVRCPADWWPGRLESLGTEDQQIDVIPARHYSGGDVT